MINTKYTLYLAISQRMKNKSKLSEVRAGYAQQTLLPILFTAAPDDIGSPSRPAPLIEIKTVWR